MIPTVPIADVSGITMVEPEDVQPVAPIDMVLHCPACGMQHIDAAERPTYAQSYHGDDDVWNNPPHRSHLCRGCGHIWRPADVATNGVAAVQTKGKADSPITAPLRAYPTEAGAALAPAAQQTQRLVSPEWVRDGIADFIADNWPDRKHTLAEIDAGIRAIEIRPPITAPAAQPVALKPLTDEQIINLSRWWHHTDGASFADLVRKIELAIGIGAEPAKVDAP